MVVAKAGSPARSDKNYWWGSFFNTVGCMGVNDNWLQTGSLTDHLFYGGNQVFIHHIFRQQSSGARLL
jgi:hypothetical protein